MASPLLLVAFGAPLLLMATRRKPKRAPADLGSTDATCNPHRRRGTRSRPIEQIDDLQPGEYVDVRPWRFAHESLRERVDRLLQAFVSDEPRPGFFYQVQDGDTLPDVAAAALESVGDFTDEQLEQYIFCISSGPRWNVRKYSTPSTSKSFGNALLVPGLGRGIRVAFLPRNDDALDAMLEGRMPLMTVDARTGAPIGDHGAFGLLWLPPVDAVELAAGEVTCAPFSWTDGSSTIDPPPELLALLRSP